MRDDARWISVEPTHADGFPVDLLDVGHAEALAACARVGVEGCPDVDTGNAAYEALEQIDAAVRRVTERRAATERRRTAHRLLSEAMDADRDVLVVFRTPADAPREWASREHAVGAPVELGARLVRLQRRTGRGESTTVLPLDWVESVEIAAS